MKASKVPPQTSDQEDCGVWLDTVQLKGKARQKRLARPISKLLNPLTEGEGYSLAVALNFTQTKMEMPKTKQSSISTFFTPYRRVLHKMSSNVDPAPSFSSSTSAARGHHIDLNESDFHGSDPGVDCEWESENGTGNKAALWQNQGGYHSPSSNCESEECKPPPHKRKLTEPALLLDDSQPQPPPQAWSQDPLFTCGQYSENQFYPTQKNYGKNFESQESSLQSEEVFENQIHVEGTTSTQNRDKKLSQTEDEKENRSVFFNSPNKHFTPLSSRKWAEPKSSSPLKRTAHRWNKAGKEARFDTQSTKPMSSPLKKPPERNREADDDVWSSLFTQDSEGFRVIAHRGQQTRSPLKDQSNLSPGAVRSCDYKSVEEDDEDDEMLFTQDSQGNMVIKH